MINESHATEATFNNTCETALNQVKNEVQRSLDSSPAIIRGYTSHLGKASGKYIRAKSLLTCALDTDGTIDPRAVKIAAAIEIFHLATLVHDDVIDDSPMRRGIETLQKKYGSKTAVICGDYLLSVAMRMISSVHDNEKNPEYKIVELLGRLCLGELNQHINNGNYSLSVLQYLKIIAGKTASLFEITFFMGASLIEKDKTILIKYAKIGRFIGMIFQLTDDCMDFESTENIALKPVQSDFEQNVITLPLIHALQQSEDFKKKAVKGELTREQINSTVSRTGGLNFTRSLAKKYKKKAISLLNQIDMPKAKKSIMNSIIEKAYRTF